MYTKATRNMNLIVVIVFIASMLVLTGTASSMEESTAAVITYVDDNTCPSAGSGGMSDPYCKIQTAVDNAPADSEIHVAEGIYTGTHTVTATNSYTYTQVVFIDKSLTLIGGFDAADWSKAPNPLNQKSIIDAERSGRGITALGTGTESVTVDGFTITGGDYTRLGNPEGGPIQVCRRTGHDCGGGLYAFYLEFDLLNSYVVDNFGSLPDSDRSSDGGGVYYYDTRYGSSIMNTSVISNTVSGQHGEGGGVKIVNGAGITITNSFFKNNVSPDQGGGLVLDDPFLTANISQSTFYQNKAKNHGGAFYASISASDDALIMDRIRMIDNQANEIGTSMYLRRVGGEGSVEAELSNILFAGSHSRSDNSSANVLYLLAWGPLEVNINHITAAGNAAETFLLAETDDDLGDTLDVVFNNALLQSFTNGYVGKEISQGELTIQHTNTLFDDVNNQEVAYLGSPTFMSIGAITGTARLTPYYHLKSSSDAIDAGVNIGVIHDIDGDLRSVENPDIGADEYYSRVYTPLVLRAEQ